MTEIPIEFIAELDQSSSEVADLARRWGAVAAAHGRAQAFAQIANELRAKYGRPVENDYVLLLLVAIERLAQLTDERAS